MPYFRKRPVVIEAMHYGGSNGWTIQGWSNGACIPSPVLEPSPENASGGHLQILTLEGMMIANPGDWIIRGIKGEFYPCKPDIFDATYEPVTTPAPPDAAEVARLTALLRECNAVCLCGCPESEHESYGEDGESCGHDDHECIRVPKAVLAYVERLRSAAPPPSDAVREAETPGTNRVEGHDEQAPDTGRTGYEAKQRNVAGDEAPGQIPEVLGVQPTDGAQADSSTGGVSNSVQTLRSRAADGTVAPAGDAVREALAEIVEWSAREAPCACNVDSPVECWLCRWHSRATAALAARPAVVDGDAVREAAELRAADVEWVVNSLAELGVKIGNQFFFLYKGESLVYRGDPDDDEGPLYWRRVGKREFGECCHPINDADPTRYGTVDVDDGREWKPLPLAARGGE